MSMETEALYLDLLTRHSYAILDRTGLYKESWHQTLPTISLVPRALRSDTQKMPALLPLGYEVPYLEPLAEDLSAADENNSRSLISCLLTVPPETDPERLQWHLTDRLVLRSPQGRAFLRYYDSRVFLHFDRILHPAQAMSLYGPVEQWTVRFQKDWITLPAPDIADMQTVPLVWQVNASQREGLDRVGTVNLALTYWREEVGRPFADLNEWRALAAKADASIAQDQRRSPGTPEENLAWQARNRLLQIKDQTQASEEMNHGM